MYGDAWKLSKFLTRAGFLAIWLLAIPAAGQVQIGDNTEVTLNGNLGVGYGGSFTNDPGGIGNGHGIFLQGQGQLSGFYYSPNFLNFSAMPYYNRNQDNSSYASVLNSTGLDASVGLFSGSHFPGVISYSKAWNDGSQYGLGAPNAFLTANGEVQNFDITWSALVPKWPTLSATWANNSTSQTILGETGTTDSHVKTINFVSTYQLDGFSLFGTYNHQNFDVTFPSFIAGPNLQSQSVNDNFSFAASHPLPWQGSFSAAYYRSNYNSSTNTVLNSGTADTIVGSFGFAPSQKFTFGGDVRYYDNLVGALQQNVIPGGGVPLVPFNVTGSGLSFDAYGTYNIGRGFGLLGYANHSTADFAGVDYSSTQAGGTLTYNYAHPLFGFMYFSAGLVSQGNNNNNGTVAGVGTVALKKMLNGWDLNADASYSQNVQNSIAWFTTSNYNYGGSVRRRFGQFTYWTTSARDTRTGMTQISGYNTHTETFMTMVSRRGVAVSGSYSQNNGTSILTTSGILIPTPLAPVISPGELIFNGTVYGGTVSVSPLKRMTITGSWFRTNSNTFSNVADNGIIYSNNSSNRIYSVLTYKFRKLDFLATYWRTNQEISSSGLPRAIQNNYSFTISRWFNVF